MRKVELLPITPMADLIIASGNAIPNSSVFKRDLNESKVTVNLVLSDRLFQTVGADCSKQWGQTVGAVIDSL